MLALIDASGVRRSWLTAASKRGPHPVAGLERLGLRGLGAQPLTVERGGGQPGRRLEQGGRDLVDVVVDQQAQIVPDDEGSGGVGVDRRRCWRS